MGTSGDDTISPLRGVDTVNGGAGDDLLIVDYSRNNYGGISGYSYYFQAYYNSTSYDQVYYSNIERFQITGTSLDDAIYTGSGNDTINGGVGNDYINGGVGNDIIIAVNPNSNTPGKGEIDSLIGGLGSDRFIIGDATWIGYDDGNTTNAGTGDYAQITDFNPTDDIIQLQGSSSNYLLTVSGINTNLYIDKPGTEPDELIAQIQNPTGLTLNASYFNYIPVPIFSKIVNTFSTGSFLPDITGKDIGEFADVNGDGRQDYVVVWNNGGKRTLATYLAKADGTFSEFVNTFSNGSFIADTTWKDIGKFADINGDGRQDYVVVWNNSGKRAFANYLAKADGTFSEYVNTLSTGSFLADTTGKDIGEFADVNGDGKQDYVVVWNNGGKRTLATYLAKADGTFSEFVNTFSNGSFIADTTWKDIGKFADINGDGRQDYVVVWNNSGKRAFANYLAKADGTFSEYVNTFSTGSFLADTTWKDIGKFADINGDGRQDYVVVWNNNGKRNLATYLAKADGTFSELVNTVSNSYFVADTTNRDIGEFADVNGDGRQDYVVAWNNDGKRNLATYLAKADGTFSELVNTVSSNSFIADTTGKDLGKFADVNGDGKQDYIVTWNNDGKRTFTAYLATNINLTLSNSNVAENQAIGTVIGNLGTTDPDTGNIFTYSLVAGTGSTDNALFTVNGNQLKTNAVFDYETKNSYSVRVRTTDQGGLFYEKALTIAVNNVNESPTNLTLSNSNIAEDQAIGTVIGSLSSTDPDLGNTFSYSLVAGTGDTNNNLFTISGNQLKANAVFDYETKKSYSIRVKTTDQGGLSYEKQLTIGIDTANSITEFSGVQGQNNWYYGYYDGPFNSGDFQQMTQFDGTWYVQAGTYWTNLTAIGGHPNGVTPVEQWAVRRWVSEVDGEISINGNLAKLGLGENGVIGHILVDGAEVWSQSIGGNDATGINYQIKTKVKLNSVVDFAIDPKDGNAFYDTTTFTAQIDALNKTPTNLTLSNSNVAENQAIGTVIGNLSTTDPDTGNTFTYSLVSGTGSTDNALFTVNGNQLKTNAVFDYEAKNSYSIRVKTTDQGGLSYEKQLTIGINNVDNIINGTANNENFVTTSEKDIIDAGAGNDTVTSDFANLRQNDIINGNTGTDILTITGGTSVNNLTIDVNNTTNQIPTILGTQILGFESFDFSGFIGTISFTGAAGNDFIVAGAGNDYLNGGAGNDYLNAGLGQDTLIGAEGKDALTGGAGSDRFDYRNLTDSLLANYDIITDFNANTDNDLFRVSTSRTVFNNVGTVATLDATGISAKLTATAFSINAAAQFTFGTRTFVAINDAIAGFNANTDAIIEVTGLTGTIALGNFTTTG